MRTGQLKLFIFTVTIFAISKLSYLNLLFVFFNADVQYCGNIYRKTIIGPYYLHCYFGPTLKDGTICPVSDRTYP